MWDQLAFDDAVEVVYEFVAKRDDTLMLITSDHGNANPGLNGMGGEYEASNKAMAQLQYAKCSFEELPNKLRSAGSADDVRDILKAQLGIEINGEEANALAGALKGATCRPSGTVSTAICKGCWGRF
jgi:alkaline phosphatase